MRLRVLDAAAVRAACSMAEAIEAVDEGFRALSEGRARVPLRTALPLRSRGGSLLCMPATLDGAAFASVKVVSVAPENARLSLAAVQAAVLVIDADTGVPRALLEGASLTALRTGAAGGLAARRLAREDARVVAIYGAGVQARTQLEAVLEARPARQVRVVAAHPDRAERFAREVPVPAQVDVRAWGSDAVAGADIVICATSSTTPVFDHRLLGEGTHVTAVGSYRPDMCELDPAALRGAKVVVDERAAALAEAGEIVSAVRAGIVSADELIEIGDRAARRSSPTERTIFKSVGNAIQDLVVASRIVANADERGLGTVLDL